MDNSKQTVDGAVSTTERGSNLIATLKNKKKKLEMTGKKS